ncbi:MAG: ABC transporter substrate-binding protein [Thermoleophilaceae bacterium]|nr:ABC transporter substrate-binding protein [Thermoleophilaceae bacterium]
MPRPLRVSLAVLVVAAAGCGQGFDQTRENEKPLKVAHAAGESKVPGEAELPLALTDGALDAILALRDEPVAALLPGARAPYYLRRPGLRVERPLLGQHLLRVKVLDPDVILADKSLQGQLWERLSKIAPTVMTEGGRAANWKLDLRLYGEALGRTNDAEALLSRWDRTAAAARRRLRPLEGTRVAVVRMLPGRTRLARPESFPGKVVADAGLVPAEERRGADVVLVSRAPGVRATPASAGLRKAQVVDDRLWWNGDGLLAARAALRELERALASAGQAGQ